MSADSSRGSLTRSEGRQILQLSRLRKLRACEKVAAVCYRLRKGRVEFLLVRTGSGHWTFPKGSVEPGLTHAQAAALEAYEEAGVHGRMEEASFARYLRGKRERRGAGAAGKKLAIRAHLCEVLRLSRPQESGRNPTWFSAGKAKRRLCEGRAPEDGAEMAHVVDCAVMRIQRSRVAADPVARELPQPVLKEDALQKVQFEATEGFGVLGPVQAASFAPYIHGSPSGMSGSAALALAVSAHLYKGLRLSPTGETGQFRRAKIQTDLPEDPSTSYSANIARVAGLALPRVPQLSNGAGDNALQNVTQIDSARRTPGKVRVARKRNR